MMATNYDFEVGLSRLKEIGQLMQNKDLSIDELVALYQESKVLGKTLHEQLDEVELSIRDIDGQDVAVILDDGADDE